VSTTVDLPDLNVWLALACPDHSHHRQAVHYWEQQAAEQVLFCTVTALGLVRLVCQPKLMGVAVKTAGEASALLEAFCQQPGVSMAPAEPHGWDVFHQLLRSGEFPARLCTDAYLAAVAMANGWRLVSFDRDFERFEGLTRLALAGMP
jgi:toxin-antitoxin system PIN domain toxin